MKEIIWKEDALEAIKHSELGQEYEAVEEIQPIKVSDGCELCEDHALERGDTLYQLSEWDGGIGFDYIRDIKFCPLCGRELEEWG